MPWFPNPSGGAPIQAPTNPNPAGGSYGFYSAPGYSGPPPPTGGSASSGGGGGGGGAITAPTGGTQQPTQQQQATQQLGGQINSLWAAAASGNKEAFDEAVREYNQNFGLDKDKFADDIRRFNENLAIAQSSVTGQFGGQQTMQSQAQNAQLYGYADPYAAIRAQDPRAAALAAQNPALTDPGYQQELLRTRGYVYFPGESPQTLAANNQAYTQQLGAITTAASLQANPFRQAQAIGQLGGLLGGQGVAGFQAPGATTGQTDFSGMGNMQRLIDDIRGGPGAINSASTQNVLNAIPTPNKLDSVNFMRSSPLTQNLVLQGMQEKYGLSPDDAVAQIKNTLPQFQSPTTFGGVKR